MVSSGHYKLSMLQVALIDGCIQRYCVDSSLDRIQNPELVDYTVSLSLIPATKAVLYSYLA